MLATLWDRLVTTQPPLPVAVTVLLGVAVLALTWVPAGYRVVRHLVTLVHEAGHAAVAAMVGRRLRAIRLHADTSGLTVSRGRPRGPGMVATLAAGYPAPALLGLGAAALLARGYAAAVLLGLGLTCALMLLLVRNLYGLWVVLVTGVLAALAVWQLPATWSTVLAHVVVWALLLAAPRSVVELQLQRRRGRSGGSDVDQLAALTWLPGAAWIWLFWLVCALALVLGALLLLR